MRALLERSRAARGAVVALAVLALLALAHAASAGDDLGIRRATFWPEPQAGTMVPETGVSASPSHLRGRRIWPGSRARPLTIALRPTRHRGRVAAASRRFRAVGLRRSARHRLDLAKLIRLPKPPRSPLVSIYQDRTLRDGDAVMMADGIHVFHDVGEWPYRPHDFVRLTLVSALDWHLRQTLSDLDQNPPTRWSSVGGVAG